MTYIYCFLIALVLSLSLNPLVRSLGARFKKLYKSSDVRWSNRYVSKGGGIAIFVSFIVPTLVFLPLTKSLLVILIGSFIVFSLGLVDDFKNVKPQTKLIGQLIAASLVVSLVVKIWTMNSPIGILSYALLIFWIIGITNAFNLIDNMDGLAAGITFITCIFMIFCRFKGIIQNQVPMVLMSGLAGASLGFLRYNFHPAKIYMGDSGSLFLGFVVSVCSIINIPKMPANTFLILLVPVLILAVPIFDTAFVMVLRGLNRISIFKGGQDHTSHRVVKLGLSERKAVLLFYFISIFFGILGALILRHPLTYMHVFMILPIIALIMFGLFLARTQVYKSSDNGFFVKKNKTVNEGAALNTVVFYKHKFLEVCIDFCLIFIAYVVAFNLLHDYKDSVSNKMIIETFPIIIRSFPILVVIKLLTFAFMKLYKGIWRYLGLVDLIGIFKATVVSSFLSFLVIRIFFGTENISARVFILDWMILFLLMEIVRGLERTFGYFFKENKKSEKKVLIFGAGDSGAMLLKEIRNNESLDYNVAGFLDDDVRKKGKHVGGVSILGGRHDIPSMIKRKHINEIIVAISSMPLKTFDELNNICEENDVVCRRVNQLIS